MARNSSWQFSFGRVGFIGLYSFWLPSEFHSEGKLRYPAFVPRPKPNGAASECYSCCCLVGSAYRGDRPVGANHKTGRPAGQARRGANRVATLGPNFIDYRWTPASLPRR